MRDDRSHRTSPSATGTASPSRTLTFSVDEGEILGFLGPNGAGKSTTMKILTGFLPPTDGHGEGRRASTSSSSRSR